MFNEERKKVEYTPVRLNADVADTLTELRRRLNNIRYYELEKCKLPIPIPKQINNWKSVSRSDTIAFGLALLDYTLTKLGYENKQKPKEESG